MRRAALAAVLALAVAAALTAACRPERASVRLWAFGREGEVLRELLAGIDARHPGLRVEVQQLPWTAAHEKLLTAFVGRATPDLAQLGNTWIPEFVALGALAPLDARLSQSAVVDRADYFDGSWASNVLDGATWGVPWYVDTRVLFYRTDLVAAAGAPWPPRTWAEWREGMARLRATAGGAERYALLVPVTEWDKPVILGLQAGASLLDAEGRHGAFRDPRFRRALAFYVDLFSADLAPPLTESGVANMYQQFADGYFAMVITGPWNLAEFRKRLPPTFAGRWSTAPLPAADAHAAYPGASLAGGSSLVVFRGAAERDDAWRVVEYLSEPAQQARFYALSGNLPARRSAWALGGLDADPQARAFRDQLLAARALPQVPEWEEIATRIALAGEEAIRGQRSLDEALAALDRDVDGMLAKRRSMLDRRAEAAR
jgi:multiple sugar transport system substrate-binding protein